MQAQLVKKLRELTGSPIIHCKKALEECQNNIESAQEWLRLKGVSQAHKKLHNLTGAGLVGGLLTPTSGTLLEVLCETDFVAKTDLFQSFSRDTLFSWASSSLGFAEISTLGLPNFNSNAEEARLLTISKFQENIVVRRGVKYENTENQFVGLYLHNTIDPYLGLSGCLLRLKSERPVIENLEKVKKLAYELSMQVVAGKPLFLSKSVIPDEYKQKEIAAIEETLDENLKNKPKNIRDGIVKGKLEKSLDSVTLIEQIFMINEEAEEKQVKKVIDELSAEINNRLEIDTYSVFACERLNK